MEKVDYKSVSINIENLDEKQKNDFLSYLDDNNIKYEPLLTNKEKSDLLENRIRNIGGYEKPNTTMCDLILKNGKRNDIKEFDMNGKSPKLQQVKPSFYDGIITVAKYDDRSDWWYTPTSIISFKSGKKNNEEGKIKLNTQHANNEIEGQIAYNKDFKSKSTFLGSLQQITYFRKDLNLKDDDLLNIINKLENFV